MCGKQRRRLNWLKRTKKERKAKWLMDKAILMTLEKIFKYGTELFTNNGRLEGTTQGIIPYLQSLERQDNNA